MNSISPRTSSSLVVRPERLLGVYGGPECVVEYPNGDEALVLLANAWLERGSVAKAAAYADRAVTANPENPEAQLVKGAVAQQGGKRAEARAAYERYLKLAPKGKFAGEIRQILPSLR